MWISPGWFEVWTSEEKVSSDAGFLHLIDSFFFMNFYQNFSSFSLCRCSQTWTFSWTSLWKNVKDGADQDYVIEAFSMMQLGWSTDQNHIFLTSFSLCYQPFKMSWIAMQASLFVWHSFPVSRRIRQDGDHFPFQIGGGLELLGVALLMRSTMKQLINGWLSWFFDLLSMKQCPSFFTKFCENPPDNSATDKVRSVCCLYFFKWFIRTKCTPLFTLFQWSCDLRKFTHRCKKNVVFGSYFDQQVSNMLWAANWMYWCHTRASFLREIGMQCKPESWYLFPEGWSNFISDRHQLVLVSVHLQLFMCWSHCMHNCISCFFTLGSRSSLL